MKYHVSEHAKIRYAQRIMKKSKKIDIQTYAMQNVEKIEKDIGKMLKYSKMVYRGRQVKRRFIVEIYVNHLWVLIVDAKYKTVITLYQINTGRGELHSKEFLEEHLEYLANAKKERVCLENERKAVKNQYKVSIEQAILEQRNDDVAKLKGQEREIIEQFAVKIMQKRKEEQRILDVMIKNRSFEKKYA